MEREGADDGGGRRTAFIVVGLAISIIVVPSASSSIGVVLASRGRPAIQIIPTREGGDINYLLTDEEIPMDALIHMLDEHAGVAMPGFMSDGLWIGLLLRNLFLMRYFLYLRTVEK